jgi:hypothetical protein
MPVPNCHAQPSHEMHELNRVTWLPTSDISQEIWLSQLSRWIKKQMNKKADPEKRVSFNKLYKNSNDFVHA